MENDVADIDEDGAFPFHRTQHNSFISNGTLETDSPYHYSHDFDGTSESDFWGATLHTESVMMCLKTTK